MSSESKKQKKTVLLRELRSRAVGKSARRIIAAKLGAMKKSGQLSQDEFNFVMGIEVKE